jgi:hypothetical protein
MPSALLLLACALALLAAAGRVDGVVRSSSSTGLLFVGSDAARLPLLVQHWQLLLDPWGHFQAISPPESPAWRTALHFLVVRSESRWPITALVVVVQPLWVRAVARLLYDQRTSMLRKLNITLVLLDDTDTGTSAPMFHPFPIFFVGTSLETGNGETSFKMTQAQKFAVCDRNLGAVSLVMHDVVMWYRVVGSSGGLSEYNYKLEGVADLQTCQETPWFIKSVARTQHLAQRLHVRGWPQLHAPTDTSLPRFASCRPLVNASLEWLPALVHRLSTGFELVTVQVREAEPRCNFYIGGNQGGDDVEWVASLEHSVQSHSPFIHSLQHLFFTLGATAVTELTHSYPVGVLQRVTSPLIGSTHPMTLTRIRLDHDVPAYLLIGDEAQGDAVRATRRMFVRNQALAVLSTLLGAEAVGQLTEDVDWSATTIQV